MRNLSLGGSYGLRRRPFVHLRGLIDAQIREDGIARGAERIGLAAPPERQRRCRQYSNYLYAILESEARIAAVAVGLDPNLGMLHVDTDSRPSLACDLMEAVRTRVDEYVLNWITRQTLRREWFFEERDGNCRLMAGLASRLAEAAPGLASAVVPIAESVARALRRSRAEIPDVEGPTTRAKRRRPESFLDKLGSSRKLPTIPRVCVRCGLLLKKGRELCRKCADATYGSVLAKARTTAYSREARMKRSEKRRRNAELVRQWKPEDLPQWLNADSFARRVAPVS